VRTTIPTRWIEPDATLAIPEDLLSHLEGDRLMAQALVNRGINTWNSARGYLDPDLYHPADPYDLPDMASAVSRLRQALRKSECIGVWGDFDVDGQTATALLVGVLRGLGAEVKFHIPVRAKESHGVNIPGLADLLGLGVDLVITCDTGITAFEAADYAREHGIDYIVTDHHSLGETLPHALAVVNPQRLPSGHPLRSLAGVGVAYEVARALCDAEGRPELAEHQVDLVALGCVADVASLQGDVRWLVQRGLEVLRNPQRVGLQALYERSELDAAQLTEQHIGFIIGPRLNAIGRLADANPVVDFLTTDDPVLAGDLAARLEGLNSERRFMTEQVFQGALAMIERDPGLSQAPALILDHPEWPAGVVGIVASRLVELYNRPTILLSSPPGEPARGSARSIEGVDITRAIAAGSDLLLGYGGHSMAAGMAIDPANLPAFRQRVKQSVGTQIAGRDLTPELQIDAFVQFTDLTLSVVTRLDQLSPFGAGNPPIMLAARNVKAVEVTTIGRTAEHLQVVVEDENGTLQRVLWWQGIREFIPEGHFDLAFTARTSNYRGDLDVQLEWVGTRVSEVQPAAGTSGPGRLRIFDYRQSMDPITDLEKIAKAAETVTWREGKIAGEPGGQDRTHLVPADTLVIWNPPPGSAEIQEALRVVNPGTVALFANPASDDAPQSFLVQLTGLVRHALRTRGGLVSSSQLSGLLNQRQLTVELGIRYLIARGFVRQIDTDSEGVVLAEPGVPDIQTADELENDLRTVLEETAAFRAFYIRADPSAIIGVS